MEEGGQNAIPANAFDLKLCHHPGTYVLVLVSTVQHILQVGKLGELILMPGFYVYVGSAFGPGGVRARVSHHIKVPDHPRWHVDYVRATAGLEEVWYTYDSVSREHQWAGVFAQMKGALIPFHGFGSSDCHCQSHLFYFRSMPSGKSFRRKVRAKFCDHSAVIIERIGSAPVGSVDRRLKEQRLSGSKRGQWK